MDALAPVAWAAANAPILTEISSPGEMAMSALGDMPMTCLPGNVTSCHSPGGGEIALNSAAVRFSGPRLTYSSEPVLVLASDRSGTVLAGVKLARAVAPI